MITLKLTEWEVMVLRAALAKHAKDAPAKHVLACRDIDRKSRAQDNPAGALKRIVREDDPVTEPPIKV